MSDHEALVTVGWRERIDLPDWGVKRIRAKIDTGARTSAIDVAEIEYISEDRVRFEIVVRTRPARVTKWIEADTARHSVVKPSSGEPQQRVVCRTALKIGDIQHEIELGLVCRKTMLCRMLIGRTALAGFFLVDPSKKYIQTGIRRKVTQGKIER